MCEKNIVQFIFYYMSYVSARLRQHVGPTTAQRANLSTLGQQSGQPNYSVGPTLSCSQGWSPGRQKNAYGVQGQTPGTQWTVSTMFRRSRQCPWTKSRESSRKFQTMNEVQGVKWKLSDRWTTKQTTKFWSIPNTNLQS